MFRLLPESLHWFVANERHDAAIAWIERAAKINKVKVNLESCLVAGSEKNELMPTNKRRTTLRNVLTSKILVFHTLLMAYLW